MARSFFRLVLLAWLVSGVGCASGESLRVGWYYLPRNEPPGMYLALVNRGREPLEITELIVNEGPGDKGVGWTYKGTVELAQGRLVLIPFREFGKKGSNANLESECLLPVSVTARLKDGAVRTIEELPAIPSAIPEAYNACGPIRRSGLLSR